MVWENNGQKLRGSKKNPIYRVLYHLKLGVNNKTNKFVKNAFRIPMSTSPTLIWYEGDETLHIPRAHGIAAVNTNSIYVKSKPSDLTNLETIVFNSNEKAHIIYKKNQS